MSRLVAVRWIVRASAALAAGGLSLSCGHSALAADGDNLEEIVVTAQRIEEKESKVPLAVSALTANQLSSRDYQSIEDFTAVIPSVSINNYIGEARINVRGIGMNSEALGADASVAFNMNGAYFSRPAAADEAFLDIDRIEVVRGPQGTLYGRNATGGAVNVITKKPIDQFEASMQLELGDYDEVGSQAVVSGPLAGDWLLGRLAIGTEDHGGYSRNLYDGKWYDDAHTQTARATLVADLADDLTVDLIADYHRENDGDYATHLLGLGISGNQLTGVLAGGRTISLNAAGQAIDPRLLDVNAAPVNRQQSGGIEAELNWSLGDELEVKSITAYRQSSLFVVQDLDGTSTAFPSEYSGDDLAAWERAHQASEEVQLIGNLDKLTFVSGLYYFHEGIDPGTYTLGLFPAPAQFPLTAGGEALTDAYAAFGQATYEAADKLNLTVGLRYSYENRSIDQQIAIPSIGVLTPESASADFHALTPKFSIDYHWTDAVMAYATISEGFKSGGFSLGTVQPAFQPEILWDYEAGIKVHADRFSVDMAAFHYDYSNLQVSQPVNGTVITKNAASSTVNGLEAEATVQLATGLKIFGTFSYLDATFDKFNEPDPAAPALGNQNLAGNQLPFASKFSSNLAVSYSMPIGDDELMFYGEWNWRDRVYFTEFNSDETSQGPTTTLNATARFTKGGDRWYVELFGKNLTDKLIVSQSFVSSSYFGFPVNGQLSPPRTFGAIVHYSFQ